MNLFKSFTFRWWQGGLFKIAMLSFGVAIGSTWPQFFIPLRTFFLILALGLAGYITYAWWKQ